MIQQVRTVLLILAHLMLHAGLSSQLFQKKKKVNEEVCIGTKTCCSILTKSIRSPYTAYIDRVAGYTRYLKESGLDGVVV